MGNLLSYKESFVWEDHLIDKGPSIMMLNEGLNSAREHGDNIYCTPDFFSIILTWGDFYQFIYETPFEQIRATRFPWLTQIQYETLTRLFTLIKNTTPASSNTLDEMVAELGGNNAYFLVKGDTQPDHSVFSHQSWVEWHQHFVSRHFDLIKSNREYFLKFYKPKLTKTPGQITALIKSGNVHPIFDRIETPVYVNDHETLHGEQIHIHFKDKKGSTLNINGEWKHGGFDIHNEAKHTLREWGFLLPDDLR